MRFLNWVTPSFIFLLGLNLLLIGLVRPTYRYFDEVRYVPAAQALTAGGVNENWSHPPLAKALIKVGVKLFGDNPLGWRFMSVLFGSLTLVFMYFWSHALFASRPAGVAAAMLCLLNQMHFVQSRVAMLDVFMVTFLTLGLAAFSAKELLRPSWRLPPQMAIAGLAFGLSAACKWAGFLPCALCFTWMVTHGSRPRWPKFFEAAFCFIIIPLAVYLAITFACLRGLRHPDYAPSLGTQTKSSPVLLASLNDAIPSPAQNSNTYGLIETVKLQFHMAYAQLTFERDNWNSSRWWSWPLMLKPNWYDVTSTVQQTELRSSGILCVGNPWILWLGLAAVMFCAWHGARQPPSENRSAAQFIVWCYLLFWLVWALSPRNVQFFYYYYPSTMTLSLALVWAGRQLALKSSWVYSYLTVCALWFYFYFPLLSDAPLTPGAFALRLLLPSWKP